MRLFTSAKAMRNLTLISIVSIALAFISCGGMKDASSEKLSGTIEIAGSSTVYPVTSAIAEEFSKLHPDVTIPVRSTGSGGGFKNFFIPGKTDINNSSRKIKDGEVSAVQEKGDDVLEFRVATDAISIVVNPDNPVSDVTVEQLKKIWQPENPAQKWSDVDPQWPDAKLELYGPTAASGTFDYFTKKIVGKEKSSRSDYQKTEQDNTIVNAIQNSKHAMGYFGMAYYLENEDKLKALKVNGVGPSMATALDGSYKPLSRPLFIYVKKSALKKPTVREYVRFYIKQTGSDLIKDVGYVPVTKEIYEANVEKLEKAIKEVTN